MRSIANVIHTRCGIGFGLFEPRGEPLGDPLGEPLGESLGGDVG